MSGAFIMAVTSKQQTLGLVEKTQDSVDRRRISLVTTEKGKSLLRTLAPYQREIDDVAFASLSKEEFQFLSKIIEDLIKSGDEAVALQRYKSSIKDDSKVA
jgi:DNA-binding MarR family transcriptional regulator